MQTIRIIQAVIVMMIVAMAASCASGKEYTNRIFTKRVSPVKDSQQIAIRFLETDSTEKSGEEWISSNIITERDTINNEIAQNNKSKEVVEKIDSTGNKENKPLEKKEIIARNNNTGEVRKKRTRDSQ